MKKIVNLLSIFLLVALFVGQPFFATARADSSNGNAGNNKITICHYPPGNPENYHTLLISENAWKAHEAHGDTMGPCDDNPPPPINNQPTLAVDCPALTTIVLNNSFTNFLAVATDIEDGNLTGNIVTIGSVATSILGTYTITYKITDSGGLSDEKNCVVEVVSGQGDPMTFEVTIIKYVNNNHATNTSTQGSVFNFHSYSSGGLNYFALGPVGLNTSNSYEGVRSSISLGSNWSLFEEMDNTVGTVCSSMKPYILKGYSTGNTLAEAQGAGLATEASLTNIQNNKFIIVWNEKCPPVESTSLKVHILKNVEGVKVQAGGVNNYQFPMTATWQAENLNGGAITSGTYVLGNNHGGAIDQYGADTSFMQTPADYTTSEITTATDASSKVLPIGAQCVADMYRLVGYSSSSTSFADAQTKTITTSSPNFVNIETDQYVIVWNEDCDFHLPNGGGNITDISASKTVSDSTPDVGQQITYTIAVSNNGPISATGVVVNDLLPTGLTFVSSTATQGSYNNSSGVWNIGTILNGTQVTLTITATVNNNTGGQTITNTANAAGIQNDSNTGNNTSNSTVTVNNNNGGGNPQCSDGTDNDSDGLIDILDPGCHSDGNVNNAASYVPNDNDELNSSLTQCSDGIDNDNDGQIDMNDSGCSSSADNDETNGNNGSGGNTQCSDGIDNDNDGLIDMNDSGCSSPTDNNETNSGGTGGGALECSDNIDNDNDGLVDTADPGCHTDGNALNGSSYDAFDDSEKNSNRSRHHSNGRGSSGIGGEVLGVANICGVYLDTYLRLGYKNSAPGVMALENFLNLYMNAGVAVDGNFDIQTEKFVREFQIKRAKNVLDPWGITESTGIVYLTTTTEINNLMCPELKLPIPDNLINWHENPALK